MEKQNVEITKEEIREFRNKYYLTTNEIIPVLDQGITTISRFLDGKIDTLDNVELVRELIDDEEVLKKRIRELYIRGIITRHIYMKFYLKMEEPREIEYVRDEELKNNIIYYMDKYDITLESMAVILELGRDKLIEIINCKVDKRLNIEDLRKRVSSEEELIKYIIKQREKGNVKRRIATIILKKIKEENPDLEIGNLNRIKVDEKKKMSDKEENKDVLTKSEKPKSRIKRVSADRRKEKNIRMARRYALQELDREIEGRSDKTNKREYLIELLYERYQEGGKMTEEDIDIVRDTMVAHPDLISNYTLKIVILGALKTLGYREADKNLNCLISATRDPEQRGKMLKYKDIIRDTYQKSRIIKLKQIGKTDAEIMKELGLGSREYYKIIQSDNERM